MSVVDGVESISVNGGAPEQPAGSRRRRSVRWVLHDPIWLITLCLMVISLVIVYSSSEMLAYREARGATGYYLFAQLRNLGLGLVLMFVLQLLPWRLYYRYSYIAFFFSVILLGLTPLLGTSINQAVRSINIMGFSFGTLEFSRLPLVLFLAAWFAGNARELDSFRRGLLVPILCVGLVCALILPGGLSLTVLAALTAFGMFVIGNVRGRHLGMIVLAGVVFLVLATALLPLVSDSARNVTWRARVASFLEGGNYQSQQAKIAIAGGRFFGKGPGAGTQRYTLPNPQDDYVYASVIEEYGLLLGIVVLLLYLALLYRIWVIARRSDNLFQSYVVMGLGWMIGIQALWHMLISVGVSPTTGITLPLVSLGGTSVVTVCAALGIVLCVSKTQYVQRHGLEEEGLSEPGADPVGLEPGEGAGESSVTNGAVRHVGW